MYMPLKIIQEGASLLLLQKPDRLYDSIMTVCSKHKIVATIALLAMLLPMSGCGLIFDDLQPCPDEDVHIEFDWGLVDHPEFYMPEGMTVLCYPTDGGDYWKFEVSVESGTINLPYNSYNILALNNDTRTINHYFEQTYNGALVFTQGISVIEATFRATDGAEPPHPDYTQPIRREADMMYVADQGDTIYDVDEDNRTITLYPQQFTPNYNIIVDNIGNLKSISTASFALSGLSGAKYLVNGHGIETPVTFPGNLAVSGEAQLTGNVVTFGPTTLPHKNILCIYVWLRNGEKFVYMYDVTDQIDSSPDPMNLTIRVGGFDLPDMPEIPDSGNAGNINLGIDNWVTVDVDLSN